MKRTIDEYMKMPYKMEIVEDPYEGGYVVSFSELPGCLTCAETIEEAIELAKDAKRCWFEAAIEDLDEIPEPSVYNKYSGQFKLRISKTLHKNLANKAKEEGVSLNQYCVYLLSKGYAEANR